MTTYSNTKPSLNESLFKDGNGFVSTSEIKFVLSRLGVEFSDEELGEMVRKSPKPYKYSRCEINAFRRKPKNMHSYC